MKKLKKLVLEKIDNNYNKYLINFFKNNFQENLISYIDIGAAEYLSKRWKKINKYVAYYGFEPDERSHTFLKDNYSLKDNNFIYSYGLWSFDGLIEINLCKEPKVSSFFEPNSSIVNLFPSSERFKIVSKDKVKVKKFDSTNINVKDFVKLDIQGGELEVLKGSENSMPEIMAMEIEVEFVELYKNQPLFNDIQQYLRLNNFEFIDFISLNRWERNQYNGFGQLIFADALFMKMPEYLIKNNFDEKKLKKYLGICILYNKYDLGFKLINLYYQKYKKNLIDINIFKKMNKKYNNKLKYKSLFNKLIRILRPGTTNHLLD
tara:strand:+ start:4333 stop:5289 length:957 start_codon:yes stop_codon:yes gene_type:complete